MGNAPAIYGSNPPAGFDTSPATYVVRCRTSAESRSWVTVPTDLAPVDHEDLRHCQEDFPLQCFEYYEPARTHQGFWVSSFSLTGKRFLSPLPCLSEIDSGAVDAPAADHGFQNLVTAVTSEGSPTGSHHWVRFL